MVDRSVVAALAGATIAISATLPETYDEAGYEGTDLVFSQIGDVEDHGNHGMTATVTEFTPVDTAVVAKVKGSKNYGNMSLMLGSVPSDTGQALARAASESNNHYSIKITYPDGIVHYIDALVSKFEYQDGQVNNVQKIAMDFAICRKPVEVAAP